MISVAAPHGYGKANNAAPAQPPLSFGSYCVKFKRQNSKIHSLMRLRLKQLNNAFSSCGSGSASEAMVFTP
jgi:hypothetical protein